MSQKNCFAHVNMKNPAPKLIHNWKKIPLLSSAAHMTQNWKSMAEIELRHPLLYLLCELFVLNCIANKKLEFKSLQKSLIVMF